MWRTVIVTQGEKLTIKDGFCFVSVNTIVALLAGEKLSSEKLLDTKDIIEL